MGIQELILYVLMQQTFSSLLTLNHSFNFMQKNRINKDQRLFKEDASVN